MDLQNFPEVVFKLEEFCARRQEGLDPIAALYPARRKQHSLFSNLLTDAEMESLRPYLFGAAQPRIFNLVEGHWKAPRSGMFTPMFCPADRRQQLFSTATSNFEDVEDAVAAADRYWKSLAWASEVFSYRKHVVKNFSRLMDYFSEQCLHDIRQQIPKTRLEAQKDFFEAKRAADLLEGSVEAAIRGELAAPMLENHTYWRNAYLPAGPSAILTPMNFIWGIPGIHLVGAYLAGVPFVFKGHPFAGLTNTTMLKMLLAAGADPKQIHKLEGFGSDIASLAADPRITVVAVTGSSETAKKMRAARGLNRLRFEGGGCNWAFVDDGFDREDLQKIAARLTYSVLGFGAHKCTSLHGVTASPEVLGQLLPLINQEMATWAVTDPRASEEVKVVSPLMVHKAQTLLDLVAAARECPGVEVLRPGGRAEGSYGMQSEACKPVLLKIQKTSTVRIDWDGKGIVAVPLATTEFFMPILVGMEMQFDDFLRFSLFENPHDLAVAVWTRDDKKLQLGRRTLGGMLKENDGTDSAMEWEEFGSSGIGDSGNMGVGEVTATFAIYCRRQKGRHVVF